MAGIARSSLRRVFPWLSLCAIAMSTPAMGDDCDSNPVIRAESREGAADLAAAVAVFEGGDGDPGPSVDRADGHLAKAQELLAGTVGPSALRRRWQSLHTRLSRVRVRGGRATALAQDGDRIAARRSLEGCAARVERVVRNLERIADADGCATRVALNGSLAGRRPFPSDNWWNRDVSAARVRRDSASVIDFIGRNTSLHADFGTDFGIPYVVVGDGLPLIPLPFEYEDESDIGAPGLPAGYPIPAEARTTPGFIEGNVAGGGSGGDRHMLLLDRDRWLLFEIYALRWDGRAWTAGSGAIFDLGRNDRRPVGWTSADAAGLAILPGLVRAEEVFDRGVIEHALRFTVRGTRGYVFPASHDATAGPGGDARPPLGLRVRLKPDIDEDSFAPPMRVIVRAMKRHGMIIADNGSDWFVSGAPDPRWDDELMHDEFARLTGNDFEAVE